MTKEELKERIADLEWEDFEVKTAKSELPKEIWESVSSFSNCYGGWIVLGVKHGVAVHDTSMSDIVREALVNFCQHADFFSPLRSSIHVFLNRIEFLNAGSFPVALNKMVGKFFSMARNPGISKMFRWTDLCENEGFGMDELLSWQKITNSKVEIESEREFSRVILYLPENGANLGANEVQTTQNGANLGANKQRILHAIQIDNTLSVLKLQVLTNIPLRTLQREINELIELGVLQKGGTRKNIIWTIKEPFC